MAATNTGDVHPCITIYNLNRESMLEILSYLKFKDLCNVALTCKHLKEFAYSKELWRHVKLDLKWDRVPENLLPSLLQKGIRRVSISPKNETHLVENVKLFPNLENLQVDFCNYGSEKGKWKHFEGLDLATLKSLSLRNYGNELAGVETVIGLVAKCVNLEIFYFTMPNPRGLTSEGLHTFFGGMRKLKWLELDGGYFFFLKNHHTYESYCETLEVLILSWSYLCVPDFFDAQIMKAIACAFPKLRKLLISDCGYFGSNFVDECAQHFSHLQLLGFQRCPNVHWSDIMQLRLRATNVQIAYSCDPFPYQLI